MMDHKLCCLGNSGLALDGKPVKLEMRKSLAMLVYVRMVSHGSTCEYLATLF